MHTPLDAHLHTPECNEIIRKLQECHAQNGKWTQFVFGVCEDLDTQMRKCTRQERMNRTKENQEIANARNENIRAKLQKQKAEGKNWRDVLEERQKN